MREQQTRFEADRDPLTGLFNRRAGERRVRQILRRAHTEGLQCALLLLDLDRFKPINDTYGHDAGDRVLVEVGRRLNNCLRTGDLIVRWGGDEFLITVVQGHGTLDVATVANNILDLFSTEIELGEGRYGRIGASIGIAVCPDHGTEADSLIELADQAMYAVKAHGKNAFLIHGDKLPEER